MIQYTNRFAMRIVSIAKITDQEYSKSLCDQYVKDFYKSFFNIEMIPYNLTMDYQEHNEELKGLLSNGDGDILNMKEISIECIMNIENHDVNFLKLVHPKSYEALKLYDGTFIKRFVHIE